MSVLRGFVDSDKNEQIRVELNSISGKLREFKELFEKRREAIAGLGTE